VPPRRPGSHRPAARLFAHDRSLGVGRVAGADEAGRGCLAGPLVAAAVCLDLGALSTRARRALGDLDDSKRIPLDVRERLYRAIMREADQVVVVMAGHATIDRDGLHRTNLRLLRRALDGVTPCPDLCLVDGFRLGPTAPAHRAITGGDARSACIAAASVIAKVTRDRLMAGPVARAHPGFGFETHVGYATPEHHAALRATGLSPVHRRSFRSVAYPPEVHGLEAVAAH
jgi:ribonuclease HII